MEKTQQDLAEQRVDVVGQPYDEIARREPVVVSEEARRKAEEYVEQEEGAASHFEGWVEVALTAVAVAMSLFHLYAAYEIVPAYIMAFKPEWLPDKSPVRWQVKIAADVVFIGSLFVLGGDFWDKLHALFVREARASFPEQRTDETGVPPDGCPREPCSDNTGR